MTSLLTLTVTTPAATRALGAAVGAWVEPGDIVALSGDLGAGKTCLVQGAAQELGVSERVTSPTFVLSRQYRGRLHIVHVDVYRLDRVAHVDHLGDDVFAPDVVTFVEWASAVEAVLPPDRLDVHLAVASPPATIAPVERAPTNEVALDTLARDANLVLRGTVATRRDPLVELLVARGLAVEQPERSRRDHADAGG